MAATVHSAAGAQAFAVFFVKTIDWGYATTSSAYMRHYYNPKTCGQCASVSDGIDADRKAGLHYLGDRFHIKRQSVIGGPQHFGSEHIVQVVSLVESVTVVDAKGDIHGADVADSAFTLQIYPAWMNGNWVIVLMNRP
ncbi:MAG: hypothetical protein ACR2KJ_15270 [Jatrophihabitans sp.]